MVKTLYLDTNIFVYLFEDREPWRSKIVSLLSDDQQKYITSVFAIAELLVPAYREKQNALADLYREKIENFVTAVISIDTAVAVEYARLRAAYPKMSRPDALHVACAIAGGADIFLTNDDQLAAMPVKGIKFRRV